MNFLRYIVEHPEGPEGKGWDWTALSMNDHFTMEMIEDHEELPWQAEGLSSNPNVYLSYVLEHPEMNWNYRLVLKYSIYSLEELLVEEKDYPIPFDWDLISANPNITLNDLKCHEDKSWDYYGLSSNRNLPWIVFILNLGRFDLSELSRNPRVTWQIVQQYPELKWDPIELSRNPSITREIVRAYPTYPWDLKMLSVNPSILPTQSLSLGSQIGGRPPPIPIRHYPYNRNWTIEEALQWESHGYQWPEVGRRWSTALQFIGGPN